MRVSMACTAGGQHVLRCLASEACYFMARMPQVCRVCPEGDVLCQRENVRSLPLKERAAATQAASKA